ncbi:hypothetical protein ACVWXP_007395 [Bradyrhizobium sp. USDA 4463]
MTASARTRYPGRHASLVLLYPACARHGARLPHRRRRFAQLIVFERQQAWLQRQFLGHSTSEAATSNLFVGKPEMSAYRNEIDVQTQASVAKFTQAIAAQVFEVNAPALVGRKVRCKVMLRLGRPLANSRDVLSDFKGKNADVLRIPGVVFDRRTALGNDGNALLSRTQIANNTVRMVIRPSHSRVPRLTHIKLLAATIVRFCHQRSCAASEKRPLIASERTNFARPEFFEF